MDDIGNTVGFDGLDLRGMAWPDGLPRFVPQIDTSELSELDGGLKWDAYAIGLRRVVSPANGDILPGWRECTAREALGLGPEQMSVLVGYGKDPLVEALWSRRSTWVLETARHEWDLVLAPNFSAYGNFPRAEHLINYRRNLLIAQELIEAGVPAVPNVYSFRLEDLERYATWLDIYRPTAIAVNLQTQRTDSDFSRLMLPGLIFLASVTPPETRFVATGSSRADRIQQLVDLFGDRLTLVSQNPIQYARHGAVMTEEGRSDVKATVPDAFAANVRFYDKLLQGI